MCVVDVSLQEVLYFIILFLFCCSQDIFEPLPLTERVEIQGFAV